MISFATLVDGGATLLILGVPTVFLVGGLVETVRWRAAIPQFITWGYPSYWPIVTSLFKVVAAAMALVPQTRVYGLLLLSLLCVVGLLTVLRCRTSQFYTLAFLMTAITLSALGVALANARHVAGA